MAKKKSADKNNKVFFVGKMGGCAKCCSSSSSPGGTKRLPLPQAPQPPQLPPPQPAQPPQVFSSRMPFLLPNPDPSGTPGPSASGPAQYSTLLNFNTPRKSLSRNPPPARLLRLSRHGIESFRAGKNFLQARA